jgi:hypothetical protein
VNRSYYELLSALGEGEKNPWREGNKKERNVKSYDYVHI